MISNSPCFNDFYPSHVTEFLRDFMMLGFESDGRHALNARHLPPKISEPAFCNREIPTQRYGPSGITSTRTTHLCTLKIRHKLTMSQTGNPCMLSGGSFLVHKWYVLQSYKHYYTRYNCCILAIHFLELDIFFYISS